QILLNWNFVWNNLVVINVNVVVNCAPKVIQPTPTPVNNPQPEPPPSRPPGKPEGGNPPINIVNPICPIGTVLSDGACRLPPDPCRAGLVRVGNTCVPLEPKPDPCRAGLVRVGTTCVPLEPKPQTCPIGMVFNDGACRPLEPR